MLSNMCHVVLYNIKYVVITLDVSCNICYITYVMLCYITFVMLCYITCVMLCYIT